MLTVDYDRLGLRPGHRLLDLGCGGGRHAFEAARRGAEVVCLDLDHAEVRDARALLKSMQDLGEASPADMAEGVCGDATRLPFPDGTFDRIIASEVMEHVPDDGAAAAELARVLRPGGVLAVTVPTWLPERICWAINDGYHAPKAVGGHVRIYTQRTLRDRLAGAGLAPVDVHHAHALHSPYWWLKCAVGIDNDRHPLVRAYHQLLVWDIARQPLVTRLADRALNPVLGKSLVQYAAKPPTPTATPTTSELAGAAA